MATLGRPLKSKTRRVPIMIHAPTGKIDTIDEYVQERNDQQEASYSRSDFYNEAATLYLNQLGKLPEEDNRTKSVPKKIGDRNNADNTNNINNINQEK